MFDTYHYTCPYCQEENEEQNKSGPCSLSHFDIFDAPIEILANLQKYGLDPCTHCGETSRIVIPRFPAYLLKAKKEYDEEN
jgi:hypothetical protein